jgi:hypothetical protein
MGKIELIRLLLRVTARTSFVFFFAAFVGRSCQILFPGKYTEWLSHNRDRFLIALGISHTIHLFVILALVVNLGDAFRLPAGLHGLLAGIFAYCMIYVLALRAFFGARGGTFWKTVDTPLFERYAMYSMWIIFAVSFLSRVRSGSLVYSFLGAAVIAGPILRITAAQIRRKKAQSAGWA